MSKRQRKEQRQRQWGMAVDSHIPMVYVSDVDKHIRLLINEIVDGFSAIGIQMVIVEPIEESERSEWKKLEEKCPNWIKVVDSSQAEPEICDIELVEEVTVDKLKALKDHRLVPVAERGGVEAFDPVEEKGNGFVYDGNAWSLFVALVKAAETYRFPYDWKTLTRAIDKAQQ